MNVENLIDDYNYWHFLEIKSDKSLTETILFDLYEKYKAMRSVLCAYDDAEISKREALEAIRDLVNEVDAWI